MVAVKFEPWDLAEHHASVFEQLRAYRKEGQLCDVKVKSGDGTEHEAHTAVLCAASQHLRMMLLGPSDGVKDGKPVEIAASDVVVSGLLEYIYGGELELEVEDSFELLRLAEAYDLPKLAAAIETGLCTSLDSSPVTTALKFLQQSLSLHALRVMCEEKVAANFESCIELVDFLELSVGQLGRILRRTDLSVPREEVVVKGLLNWLKRSEDRRVHLPLLLHHIDLLSLSSGNLARLGQLSNLGPIGHDLQTEVSEALQARKKRSAAESPENFSPKRQCLQHWSNDLGASSQAPQKVLPHAFSLCWHDGAIYYTTPGRSGASIFRWKPGDSESQVVAGLGATVSGVNDLGRRCVVSVSPEGEIFVADEENRRLVSFRNGSGNVVRDNVDICSVSCSASGAVYMVTVNALEKLVGATLHPLASLGVADLSRVFVTKDETVYMSDSETNSCIFRLKPGEAEPVIAGEAPLDGPSRLLGLCATEDEKVYVADYEQRKVWAFHPGDTTWTEVVACPGELKPKDVLVQGRSLYVSMSGSDPTSDDGGVYEYLLPPKLQLE